LFTDLSELQASEWAPGQCLDMNWNFMNTGQEDWPHDARIIWVDGEKFNGPHQIRVTHTHTHTHHTTHIPPPPSYTHTHTYPPPALFNFRVPLVRTTKVRVACFFYSHNTRTHPSLSHQQVAAKPQERINVSVSIKAPPNPGRSDHPSPSSSFVYTSHPRAFTILRHARCFQIRIEASQPSVVGSQWSLISGRQVLRVTSRQS
jgi:hypothetical protein